MLWGGRFKSQLDQSAFKFSSSFGVDKKLIHEDIFGSIIQAEMLLKIGILNQQEFDSISDGLRKIEKDWNEGKWIPNETQFEDIHSAVETYLKELIGDAAGKLHTGRSRNDQVATDSRLWVKKATKEITSAIEDLQKTLLILAEKHTETLIPGYTHLQRGQPISFAFHMLAYVEMLERDKNRFNFVFDEANFSPLGSGALAGSTLPLDRQFTSEKLGFQEPTRNALDSVSDRDFMLDFLHSCSIGMMHLSRFSEEIIIWSSVEWNFIRLADEWTTGSSLMPQKKNPDMAELIRGKFGRTFGNYTALLTTMKSLPLSYNRDLQEDKESLFDSFETFFDSLLIMTGMMSSVHIKSERFKYELEGDFSLSTDLADWLVVKGIPFRESHHLVGQIVQLAETKQVKLHQLQLSEIKEIHSVFDETALDCFKIETALNRKKTFGSPNPSLVKKQIEEWLKSLNKSK